MVMHLFSSFLEDERGYRGAERYWIDLWETIDQVTRNRHGWKQPWFQPLAHSISEGNPIFSAVSLRQRRAIRIIQSVPTENGLEFVAYLDTFGGSTFDPNAIHELVISCALSDEAARVALSKMLPWVEGKAVCFDLYEAGLIASNDLFSESIYADLELLSEPGIISSCNATDEGNYASGLAA